MNVENKGESKGASKGLFYEYKRRFTERQAYLKEKFLTFITSREIVYNILRAAIRVPGDDEIDLTFYFNHFTNDHDYHKEGYRLLDHTDYGPIIVKNLHDHHIKVTYQGEGYMTFKIEHTQEELSILFRDYKDLDEKLRQEELDHALPILSSDRVLFDVYSRVYRNNLKYNNKADGENRLIIPHARYLLEEHDFPTEREYYFMKDITANFHDLLRQQGYNIENDPREDTTYISLDE